MRSGPGPSNQRQPGGMPAPGGESGQALPLVLILLLLGSLMLPPLLAYTSGALKAASAVEARMLELYAADSGIEDAVYKLMNGGVSESTYFLDNEVPLGVPDIINGTQVEVTTASRWLLEGLEDTANGATPHQEWAVAGRLVGPNTYAISATYDGSAGIMRVNRIGAWLPRPYEYMPDSTYGDLSSPGDEPDEVFSISGGTALKWDLKPPATFPMGLATTKWFYFEIRPSIPAGRVPEWLGDFAWITTTRQDIAMAWDPDATKWRVTARAIDPSTGSVLTEVRCTVNQKDDEVALASWEVQVFSRE